MWLSAKALHQISTLTLTFSMPKRLSSAPPRKLAEGVFRVGNTLVVDGSICSQIPPLRTAKAEGRPKEDEPQKARGEDDEARGQARRLEPIGEQAPVRN